MNDSKTEVTVFTPSGHSSNNSSNISSGLAVLSGHVQKDPRNGGVTFDSQLSFDTKVTKVPQACFTPLRLLSKVKSSLSLTDVKTVLSAFISSRRDYCTELYSDTSKNTLQRLQLIEKAMERFLPGTRGYEHVSPVLAVLHWFPVSLRVNLRILQLVIKPSVVRLQPVFMTNYLPMSLIAA